MSNLPTDNTAAELERLRFALQSAQIGTWTLDISQRQVWWDDRCKELYGFNQDDIVPYDQVISYIYEEDRQRVDQAVQWALDPQSGGHYAVQFRTRGADDGLIRWLLCRGRADFDADGVALRFAGTAQDITQQVVAQQALQQSEARFQNLVRQANVGMNVLLGQELRVTVVNEAYGHIIGHRLEEMQNRPLFELIPDAESYFRPLLEQVMVTGEPLSQQDVPYKLRSASGQIIEGFIDYLYQPYREADGRITGVTTVINDVTQLVNSRLELAKQQTHLQNAIDIGDLGTFEVDVLTQDSFFSERIGRWFGLLPPTQPLARFLARIHRDDQGMVQRALDESMRDPRQSRHDITYRIVDAQGTTTHYLRSIGETQFMDGQPQAINGMIQDVTEQVQARQKLEESEARFRSIVQQSPAATLVLRGEDLVIDQINQPMLSFMGRSPEVIGHPLVAAVPELDGQDILQQARRVYSEGVNFDGYEVLIPHARTGVLQNYYYDLSYRPLLEGGHRTGVIQVVTDVTAQVLARQQLVTTEARLRTIITHLPSATVVFRGRELVVETPSQNFISIIDRGPDVEGKPLGELMPELESQSFLAILDNVFMSGQSFRAFGTPVTIHQADGSTTNDYFDLIYTPLFDSEDQVYAILSVATNVTDIVATHTLLEESETRYRLLSTQLEQQVKERTAELLATNEELATSNEEYAAINEELEESNSLLVRSNENLQTFAYIASHDLQEPLRKIQQFGNLLQLREGEGSLDAESAGYVERMQTAASRMSTLIKDLLNYSRISTQRSSEEPVSLNKVVGIVLDTLDMTISQSNAQVQVDVLPIISGDAVQLGQLFQNLLSNALKFHRPDAPPRIHIRSELIAAEDLPARVNPARRGPTYECIQVIDNGIGFEEKYLDRLFQVFQRLHGKNEFAGTGVGLAIVQKVVTNHGGAITAISKPNQGATFCVYLPAW